MAPIFTPHHLATFFGLLGNIISFLGYLSPLPTFYSICKVKSIQGFDSIPYMVALFSAMLTLYYGLLKQDTLLITINSFGIVIESFYLTIYLIFTHKAAKLKTIKILLSFNIGLFGLIVLFSSIFTHGTTRVYIMGWFCAICSTCTLASPLCVVRTVIKTKSVEFMPFWLSFSVTISAIVWFFYGFFIKDLFVALPNVLGLLFGLTQMALYFIYRGSAEKKKASGQAAPAAAMVVVQGQSDDPGKVLEAVVVDVKAEPTVGRKLDEKNRVRNSMAAVKVEALEKYCQVECAAGGGVRYMHGQSKHQHMHLFIKL